MKEPYTLPERGISRRPRLFQGYPKYFSFYFRKNYGAEVDFANREVLRKIVYEYGLNYDYRMLLFVKGDTEFHAIPIIADAMGISFARLGIRLEKLGGYSEIAPRRIEKLLQYAQRDNMIAYIIIDNHQGSKKFVDELISERICPWKEIEFEFGMSTLKKIILRSTN